MQACRPRALEFPLQIGLGVQLHSQYGSYSLIETLHSLGLCCSFKTARTYEKCAVISLGTYIYDFQESFIQYVADNVDHNVCTIDGHGTFHGMGIIAAITPKVRLHKTIPKIKVTPEEIARIGAINIKYHKDPSFTDSIKYNIPMKYEDGFVNRNLDLLWKCSGFFSKPQPSWQGVMQMIHQGSHPGKSSIKFLPMIDMSSSDPSCIYSTLCFVSEHAQKYNSTPIITFDQPLWLKEFLIIEEEPSHSDLKNIVVRLGSFHTEMSFIGAIGHLMADSGLKEVLETVYASVDHILSGKAISRAVRAHLLIDKVLGEILLEKSHRESRKTTVETNETQLYDGSPIPKTNMAVNEIAHLESLSKKMILGSVSTEDGIKDHYTKYIIVIYNR